MSVHLRRADWSRGPHVSLHRSLRLEPLEDRRLLAGRAADAINLFALDVYEHLQQEQGNLFFSPLSIATGLAMTYAGAAGATAAEMESVLHLGSEPGIHSSFNALLSSFDAQMAAPDGFDLIVANAVWPRAGLDVHDSFLNTIESDYRGHAEAVDYSDPDQAEERINSWIAEKTLGRIQDLVDQLSPLTAMVLTNSVYFKALWAEPFDPNLTDAGWVGSSFYLEGGEEIEASMMYTQSSVTRTFMDDYQVMEMPFTGGNASMVFVLPPARDIEVTTDLLMQVDEWLATSRTAERMEVSIPKFQITVDSDLKELLFGMGMPTAFGGGADFSGMFDEAVFIDDVLHKAFLEVNESGTEAAAATSVELLACFAAGTPVLTPDGEKPIEEVKAGDYVLARDEHNLEGPVQPKMVERALHGHADIVELHVGGKIIRTTGAHPFFVQKKGWTPANEVRPQDRLSTNLCDWIEVESVVDTKTAEPVYNLRVADHRTYFVGGDAWGFAVWAHNFYGSGFYADRPFHFFIRDNISSTIAFMGRITDPTQAENSLKPMVEQVSADFDGDLDVDGRDFLRLQIGLGLSSGANRSDGDANGDAQVNSDDVRIWEQSYGKASAAAATIDEVPGQSSRPSFRPDAAFTDDGPRRRQHGVARRSDYRALDHLLAVLPDLRRELKQKAVERTEPFL